MAGSVLAEIRVTQEIGGCPPLLSLTPDIHRVRAVPPLQVFGILLTSDVLAIPTETLTIRPLRFPLLSMNCDPARVERTGTGISSMPYLARNAPANDIGATGLVETRPVRPVGAR